MLEDDFKFSYLTRSQLIRIIEVYNLDIDKSLPRKKLLEELSDKLSILDDGTIVHKEDKNLTKEQIEGTGKYKTHLMGMKIKYLN
jgi:hypothetical protein